MLSRHGVAFSGQRIPRKLNWKLQHLFVLALVLTGLLTLLMGQTPLKAWSESWHSCSRRRQSRSQRARVRHSRTARLRLVKETICVSHVSHDNQSLILSDKK